MTDDPTPREPPTESRPARKTIEWSVITKRLAWLLLGLLLIGLLVPGGAQIPVQGATSADWNPDSFWYEPWGTSGVHKGVDIFAQQGTPVVAASSGWIMNVADTPKAGKTVLVLGPKWRFYDYAHLHAIHVTKGSWLSKGDVLGEVGNTGNAAGKAPHLHFAVFSMVPRPWAITSDKQGWKRMFFVDPTSLFPKP
ncbi:MAG: M23 family metallopeptidase [Acidobacteria bacterium]|nr:M23 family metallopeptidase [Acidobacteriota bacterium]